MEAKNTTFKQKVMLLHTDTFDNNQDGTVWGKPDDDRREFGIKVELSVRHNPLASVLFRLSSTVQLDHGKILLYLQITPDRFLSFQRIIYNTQNEEAHPPYLHIIREKMCVRGDVMCLQFELNEPGELLMPMDFNSDDLDLKQRHELSSFMSLATASVFSLYMQPNVLPSADFSTFNLAIRQWSKTTQDQKNRFMQMANHQSLYGGTGGKLYKPLNLVHEDSTTTAASVSIVQQLCNSPPPYDAEEDSFSSPAGSESDIATVATNTPPRYRLTHCDSREKQTKSPGVTMSDAVVFLGDKSPDDGYPPAYGLDDASSACITENARKRRKHNQAYVCEVTNWDAESGTRQLSFMKAGDGEVQDVVVSRTPGAVLAIQALVSHIDKQQKQLDQQQKQLDQQQEQFETMQHQIERLKKQKNKHGLRLTWIENNQDQTREDLDSLSVDVDEVHSEMITMKEQLPSDIHKEVESWACENLESEVKPHVDAWVEENLEGIVDTWVEEHMESGVSRSVDTCVKASIQRQTEEFLNSEQRNHIVNKIIADVKDKIRSALAD